MSSTFALPKIHIVISESNDETSLCNRAFWSHDKAWKYLQQCERNPGGKFRMFAMRIDADRSEMPVGICP
jgi:hypothetical protein